MVLGEIFCKMPGEKLLWREVRCEGLGKILCESLEVGDSLREKSVRDEAIGNML